MTIDAEKLARLAKVRTIVVHPGLAHVDDIVSCALAFAFGVPHDAVIERRKPTEEDLASLSALVLDVGFAYDPQRLCFDHHQRVREEAPKCAYTLFAEWLGVDGALGEMFPWYAVWNDIDVLGPYGTAKKSGADPDVVAGLVENPLSGWVIRHFADNAEFRGKVALGLAKEIVKTFKCWEEIVAGARNLEIAGVPVADLRACETEVVSRCSDAWARRSGSACLVFRDNRGTGLTFLRVNDDARLDFYRCASRPYCLFAHTGGFVLKTKSPDDDPVAVLNDAKVPSEKLNLPLKR